MSKRLIPVLLILLFTVQGVGAQDGVITPANADQLTAGQRRTPGDVAGTSRPRQSRQLVGGRDAPARGGVRWYGNHRGSGIATPKQH